MRLISPVELNADELARYRRQIGAGALSQADQVRLRRSTVLVTRAGGMGGPAASCLVMAGVGKVILAHSGNLETADLNRQSLGSERGLGEPRIGQFVAHLKSLSRFVEIEGLAGEPDDRQALALARRVDVILSCPPNFEERMRLNRAAVAAGVPLVDAAQWGLMGTLTAINPGRSPCLACIYPQGPEFEELFPVLGAISSAIGALAALEAVKILAGIGEPLFGRMLSWDGLRARAVQLALKRNLACEVCGPSGLIGEERPDRRAGGTA